MARKRKATKRKAKTTKGWSRRAPKTKAEREATLKRCGRKAFLDPDNLRYPIMAKSGPCVVNCQAVRAAKSRSGQYKHKKIQKKAQKVGKTAACAWAR